MEPLRLLPDMESFHRLMGDRLPRLAGSVPLSALLSSTQFSSSCSPCSGGGGAEPGIGPTAANRGRSAALGSRAHAARLSGIGPLSLLLLRSQKLRLVALQNDGGMEPLSAL